MKEATFLKDSLLKPSDSSWSRVNTQRLVFLGLMVALNVVLGRFTSVQLSNEIRLSFVSFLPIALAAHLMGPMYGALAGAAGDIVNYMLFNHAFGAYFPGYTLTAALSGLWYGLLLYRRKVTWPRAILAILPVIVLGEMGLNSLWVWMMYRKTFWAKLPMRLLTNAIECPLKILLLSGMTRLLERMPPSYLKM